MAPLPPSFAPLSQSKISVVGLGYVGLPLALALGRRFQVTGFDIDRERLSELKAGSDRTGEVDLSKADFKNLQLSDDTADIKDSDIFIITVPTPVDKENQPDLTALIDACHLVGRGLKKNSIVVFESTVFPGVTEDICGPALETKSNLKCGSEFFLGYSPERVNPGDKDHGIEKITKIVSGSTPEVAGHLEELYGSITSGGIHVAKNIKTAEAAKVIENAQRDINIAFINEVAQIFDHMGISTQDVLEAASTKWNFLSFKPGLVGGHCIGVDPYYLAHAAHKVDHDPEIILAGRRINDGMAQYVAERISKDLENRCDMTRSAKILFLGLTFKEDVPDLRNSKAAEVISHLQSLGHSVDVHDPIADTEVAEKLYGLKLLMDLEQSELYDCLIGAVAHKSYRDFKTETLQRLVRPGGLIADIKGMWRSVELPGEMFRWQL